MNRINILREVYEIYQRCPDNIGQWLREEILEEEYNSLTFIPDGTTFFFCENCGLDYLNKPVICESCYCQQFKHLGAYQGLHWRNKKFKEGNFRYRFLVTCPKCNSSRINRTTGVCNKCKYIFKYLPNRI